MADEKKPEAPKAAAPAKPAAPKPPGKIVRKLNWRPSLPDMRDFKYGLHMKKTEPMVALPPKIDRRVWDSPIVDQLQLGSCTGNALAGAKDWLQTAELRNKAPAGKAVDEYIKGQFQGSSRMFIYQGELLTEGTFGTDAGATTMRDGCDVLLKQGCPSEKIWAYDMSLFTTKPTPEVYDAAAKSKIAAYYALEYGDIKRCVYHGFPCTIGFTVYDSFMSDAVAATGIMPMPDFANESVQGGHAVLIVGYDDVKGWYIVRNSWGTSWGDNGYFYMPYAYAANTQLCDDMYTVRRAVSGAVTIAS